MDVIIIKLPHLETGCCFPQLHAITRWKMKMSLERHYFFHRMKQASDLQSDFKTINLKRVLRLALLVFWVPSVAKDSSG